MHLVSQVACLYDNTTDRKEDKMFKFTAAYNMIHTRLTCDITMILSNLVINQ